MTTVVSRDHCVVGRVHENSNCRRTARRSSLENGIQGLILRSSEVVVVLEGNQTPHYRLFYFVDHAIFESGGSPNGLLHTTGYPL